MGSPVKNIQQSVSNLSSGKNLPGSLISLSTGGLVGAGEEAPGAQSFSSRLDEMVKAGAFGGMTLAQAQAQSRTRQDSGFNQQQAGFGYQTQAAENALAALRGETPSIAQLQFQKGLQDSIAAQQSAAQSGGVDAALAYRIAAEEADKQRQASLINAAMLRAQEIQGARQDLGTFGANIGQQGLGLQNLYSNEAAQRLAQITGVQAQATQQQQQSALAQFQADKAFQNALLGAAATGLGTAATGGATTPKQQQQPTNLYGNQSQLV